MYQEMIVDVLTLRIEGLSFAVMPVTVVEGLHIRLVGVPAAAVTDFKMKMVQHVIISEYSFDIGAARITR